MLLSTKTGLTQGQKLGQRHARAIELIRRQYSGNEHRVIRGIGLISYQLKHGMLCDYLIAQLKNASVPMMLA